jgi:hypothetical protein
MPIDLLSRSPLPQNLEQEDKRARERAARRRETGKRRSGARFIEEQRIVGWPT